MSETTNINWDNLWKKEKNSDWWKTPAEDFINVLKKINLNKTRKFYDLGCGIGRHTILLSKAGYEVYASDSSGSAINQLKDSLRKGGLGANLYVCDMEERLFGKNFFDFVLSYNVIYHGTREKMKKTIDNVSHMLKPGGYFYFTCPTTKDGRCGSGEMVAPQTYKPDNAEDKGEIHYFTGKKDLKDFLSKFNIISIDLSEGSFQHRGRNRFYSNWLVLAQKNEL